MKTTPDQSPQEKLPPMETEMDNAMPDNETMSESVPHKFERPKVGIYKSIDTAKQTIIGSKSIPTEIDTLKDSYVDFFKKSVTSNLKAVKELATLHPIKAVKEFAFGTTGNLNNMAKIVTSPSRMAVAGGASVLEVAKLPFKAAGGVAKSPLWVWDKMKNGTDKLFNIGKRFDAWNKIG